MAVVRKLLLVALAAGALYGVQACASETELNPQPLPPEDPGRGQQTGADESADGKGTSSGAGGGSSGTSGAPNAGVGDAGADGDADGGGG